MHKGYLVHRGYLLDAQAMHLLLTAGFSLVPQAEGSSAVLSPTLHGAVNCTSRKPRVRQGAATLLRTCSSMEALTDMTNLEEAGLIQLRAIETGVQPLRLAATGKSRLRGEKTGLPRIKSAPNLIRVSRKEPLLAAQQWSEMVPEVLSMVFEKLSLLEKLAVVPLVSKNWRKAVQDPWLYKHVNAEDLTWSRSPKQVQAIVTQVVRLSRGKLEDLSITHCTTEALLRVAAGCPELKTLCVSSSYALADTAIIEVARRCPQLTQLDVSNCTSLSDASIQAVCGGPSPSSSKTDKLIGCQVKLQEPPDHMLPGSKLVRLNMNMDGGSFDSMDCGGAFGSRALRAVAQHCPKMRHLAIAGNRCVGDKVLADLAIGCPDLASLDMTGCASSDDGDHLTREGVKVLLQKCKTLKELILPKPSLYI